jgi:hypothetical protein
MLQADTKTVLTSCAKLRPLFSGPVGPFVMIYALCGLPPVNRLSQTSSVPSRWTPQNGALFTILLLDLFTVATS